MPSPHFYFVCKCDAKMFARMRIVQCPRCGARTVSEIQIEPPWLKERTMPCEPSATFDKHPRS